MAPSCNPRKHHATVTGRTFIPRINSTACDCTRHTETVWEPFRNLRPVSGDSGEFNGAVATGPTVQFDGEIGQSPHLHRAPAFCLPNRTIAKPYPWLSVCLRAREGQYNSCKRKRRGGGEEGVNDAATPSTHSTVRATNGEKPGGLIRKNDESRNNRVGRLSE